jgi:hypothetical protein
MDVDIAEQFMGPRLRALSSDRQRRFAVLYAAGELSASQAALEAGYSDGGKGGGVRVRAHELIHNPDVKAAVEECTRDGLAALAPMAVVAARNILENPKHPHHGRMIEAVLDRTGFAAQTQHTVKVEHTVDTRELEALARRLAQESGIPVQRLLGTDKVIEHEPAKEANKELELEGPRNSAAATGK